MNTDSAVADAPAEIANTDTQKPKSTIKVGRLSLAHFATDVKLNDGREFVDHSISIRRSFKTADGNWDNRSLSVKRNEVGQLIAGLQQILVESYQGASESEE